MMDKLREASESVTTSAEVVRYIQDIVVFLRLSRAVGGGISAKANFQLARFAESVEVIPPTAHVTNAISKIPCTFTRHRLSYTFNRGSRCEKGIATPYCRHGSWPRSKFTVWE